MNSIDNTTSNADGLRMPMAYPSGKSKITRKGNILAGDVGGTKTNLALFQIQKGQLLEVKQETYSTTDFNSFTDMTREFNENDLALDALCLGVAGPITQGKVHGTNFPWEIDKQDISEKLKMRNVYLINDMEANAFGLSALEKEDLETLMPGKDVPGNAVILSPGTGLGEAGLFWDGTKYHPFPTEGGHCDFGPRNELDLELWHYLGQKYGHISWERVLSGQGICDLYDFIRHYRDLPESKNLLELSKNHDRAAAITHEAFEGDDPACKETLNLFTGYLAVESAQLALKMKATGGVYIGGGIVPKILKGIHKGAFRKNFLHSGRLDSLLSMIPVKVVLNDKTALRGAALYASMMM